MPADAPGLPRGLPGMPSFIPKLPRAPKALVAEGGSLPCAFLEKAARAAGALGEAREFGRGTGEWLSENPVFGAVAPLVRQIGDGPSAPRVASDTVSGMGLAAFVEVTGEVSPKRVAYGDGPLTFEVKVESRSPFTQAQLDAFVGCLESASPASVTELAPLRRLPPKGAIASLPVTWEGGDAFDPRQGTLSPGAATDGSGRASAKFQVKPKTQGGGATEPRTFTLVARVAPFPAGAGGVANRSVPLAFEIEVPASKDWQLVFKQNMLASGERMSGGWTLDAEATVPFSVGAGQELSGKGSGTWSYGFKGSAEGVTCSAPTEKYPLTMQLTGKGPSNEGGSAHFSLSDTASGGVNSTLTCTGPGGISVSVPMKGPAGGSFLKGTQADGFDMPLEDGASKSWPVSHQSAKGTAKVTLQAK